MKKQATKFLLIYLNCIWAVELTKLSLMKRFSKFSKLLKLTFRILLLLKSSVCRLVNELKLKEFKKVRIIYSTIHLNLRFVLSFGHILWKMERGTKSAWKISKASESTFTRPLCIERHLILGQLRPFSSILPGRIKLKSLKMVICSRCWLAQKPPKNITSKQILPRSLNPHAV